MFHQQKAVIKIDKQQLATQLLAKYGQTKYTRFAIASTARSGSTWLQSLLQQCPNIMMAGELFAPEISNGNRLVKPKTHSNFDRDFSYFTKGYSESIQAVGCRIFYYHLTDAEWQCFQSADDFRLIHLTRRNKMRMFLSLEIAKKTRQWRDRYQKKPSLKQRQVWIDVPQLIEYVQWIKDREQEFRQQFEHHEILEIAYEDMVMNLPSVVSRLSSFLGVHSLSLTQTALKKQNTESMQKLILNFDEVKDTLANTSLEIFLQEDK